MAGGIPSGATPQPTAGTPDPTTGFDATTMPGAIVAGGIANLAGMTQEQVTSGYQSQVQSNPTLTGYSATVFDGMSMDGSTSPFLVIIMMIANVLGLGGGTSGGLGGFLGTIGDLILTGISDLASLIGGLIGGFLGIFGASGSADDLFGIVRATAATIAANSAAIQAMQNADAADSNNGANVFLDFSSADMTGFATSFSESGASFEVNSSGDVQLMPPSSANCTGYALYTDQPTDTDDQIVSVIYATSPGRYDFLGLAEGSAYNIIICRSNLAMTTYVYAAVGPFGASLHNVVDGADTQLEVVAFEEPTFYTGAAYSLQAGFGESAETYELLVNGGTLLGFEDTAGVTNIGEEYRYTGFGLVQNLTMVPSQVAAFGLVDDSPADLIGDLFRAYSDSAATTLPSELVAQVFPANFYNQIEYQSSNYTYTAATNTLQVSTPGVYVVKVSCQWFPNSADSWAYFGTALFKNGESYEVGNQAFALPPGAWPYYIVSSTTFIVPMTATDTLQPALCSMSSPTADDNQILGDVAGQGVVFECALLNTGLASTSSS